LRTHLAPLAPRLGRAQFDTLRLSLLKVAALVSHSTRRLLVRLPHAFPLAPLFRRLATTLARPPVLSSAYPRAAHSKFSLFSLSLSRRQGGVCPHLTAGASFALLLPSSTLPQP